MDLTNLTRLHLLCEEAGEGGGTGEGAAPAAPDTSSPAPDVSAGSSPAGSDAPAPQGDDKAQTPLEAVKAALAETAEQRQQPPMRQAPQADAGEAGDGKAPTDAKDGEPGDADLPFGQHPRFRQVLQQRREAIARADALADKAGRLDQLADSVVQLGLSAPEYDVALNLAAAAKRAVESNDAQAASKLLEHFESMTQRLQFVAGKALPPDVQDRVDSGAMSEEEAHEFVRLRMDNDAMRRVMENERQASIHVHDQRVAQQAQAQAEQLEKALVKWETDWMGSDPDYKLLSLAVQGQIIDQLNRARAEGKQFQSAADIVTLAQRARDDVRKQFGARLGTTRSTSRPPTGGSPNANLRAKPTTPRDVVRLALQGD